MWRFGTGIFYWISRVFIFYWNSLVWYIDFLFPHGRIRQDIHFQQVSFSAWSPTNMKIEITIIPNVDLVIPISFYSLSEVFLSTHSIRISALVYYIIASTKDLMLSGMPNMGYDLSWSTLFHFEENLMPALFQNDF